MIVDDPASNSNNASATINHISLDWNVDFGRKCIFGVVELFVRILNDTANIILDGRSLTIKAIRIVDMEKVTWTKFDENVLGERYVIEFDKRKSGDEFVLTVEYNTGEAEKCTALQFLNAEQTTDKLGPYLFSQCQEINCRSLLPCMDTPLVKQSYEAKVTVPSGFTCLMSAMEWQREEKEDFSTFYFKQFIPIPSYLFAIVVGILEKRSVSDRCAIWAEPSVVDKAFFEFSEVEDILCTTESIIGPYVWERYDLVVLPSSFPFGGMENPNLTFVTPTLLAGDRSLVRVIVHEIAHSWTGNLVTNANWEHFWLNEGFTVFLERKVLGRLYGEDIRHFEAEMGWNALELDIKERFSESDPFTKLVQQHGKIDPFDAFNIIPYEKGSAFLMYLEQILTNNDPLTFENCLRDYIEKYRYKSVTSSDFKSFLYEYFQDKTTILDSVDWQTWFFCTGTPPNKPSFNGRLIKVVDLLAKKFLTTSESDIHMIKLDEFNSFTSSQKVKFLRIIYSYEIPLSLEKIEKLDSLFGLSLNENCEIFYWWILISIKARWKTIIPLALSFVSRQGRLKYIQPIYSDLFKWDESASEAISTFQKNIPFMHPMSVAKIKKILKL